MKRFNIKGLLADKASAILLRNIIFSYFFKGLSILLALFSTPAYLRFFENNEVLGIWYAIISFVNMIVLLDFGLGNGLRNQLVPVFKKKDYNQASVLISSAYASISVASIVLIIASVLLIPHINWMSVLNINADDAKLIPAELVQTVITITISGVLVHLVVKIISSILYSLQLNFIPGFFTLFNSVAMLLFLFLGKTGNIAVDMRNLAIVQALSTILPQLIATIIVFNTILKKCKPHFRNIAILESYSVIRLGLKFFYIQVMLLLIQNTNEYLIKFFYSGEAVVEYHIYYKVLGLIVTMFSLVSQPLWSSFSVAFVEKRGAWIRKTYNKMWLFFGCAFALNLGVSVFLQFILDIWLRADSISVSPVTSLLIMLMTSMIMITSVTTSVANGANRLKCQMICFSIGMVLKFVLSYVFSLVFSSWYFIIVAEIISLLPIVVSQMIINEKIIRGANVTQ